MDKPDMQKTFDTVARHLLKQGRRAEVDSGFAPTCVYRAPGGLKCAVGCLIPDDLYDPDMEGTRVDALLETFPILRSVPLINGFEYLLARLQAVHDGNSPERWKNHLRYVASKFGLSSEVLDA